MRFGIFAKTFPGPTLGDTLDAVVAHRLDCIQFNFACAGLPSMPEYISPEAADQMGQEIQKRHLRVVAVSGTFNMIHPDAKKRAEGLRRLAVVAGACASLGTSTISLCTGTRDAEDMWRSHPENDSPDAWDDLVASLAAALEIAEKFNLTLGIEPETANVISSAPRARWLLDEMKSPRLKIIFDAANLFRPGDLSRQQDILDEAFDLLGEDIAFAHAKDVREENGAIKHVAAGKGLLDYNYYLWKLEYVPPPLVLHGLEPGEVAESIASLQAISTHLNRMSGIGPCLTTAKERRRSRYSRARFFERDGIQFHYRDTGEGLPFLFQHGLGANVGQPFDLFKPPTGFRLIAFDCRFHGGTHPAGDEKKISFNVFADDLLALLDFLKIERAVIGGISMGAAVALNFALRFPERTLGLVLQRPAWLAEPNRRNAEIYGFIAKLICGHDPQAGVSELKRSKLYKDILAESPDCANALVQQLSHPRAKEAVGPLERIPLDAPNRDRAEWRQIKVAALVLANRQDPIHPFEFGEILAREIPGAEFHELTSKSVSIERYREDSQRFIAEFLKRHFAPMQMRGKSPHEQTRLC